MNSVTFESLLPDPDLATAVSKIGWTNPTPIQQASIPAILEGHDVLAVAMTGSGKTGAYLLPWSTKLQDGTKVSPRRPRLLILVPTRELAQQVAAVLEAINPGNKVSFAVVYGGVGYARQRKLLASGIQVLIATPGRLIDLMDQGHCLLDQVDCLVLDEADRMLDMGFQPAIETIAGKLPENRQSLFFSATFPPPIRRLAMTLLRNPREIMVDAPSTIVDEVEQRLLPVKEADKQNLIHDLLSGNVDGYTIQSAIIFTNSRVQAGRLTRYLARRGLAVAPIHGGMSQSARDEVLGKLRSGSIRALIATDVLARGIDVHALGFVINYEVPLTVESYVHRIGRTARAGNTGVSLTLAAPSEIDLVSAIERHLHQRIDRDGEHPYAVKLPETDARHRRVSDERSADSTVVKSKTSAIKTKTRRTKSGKTITVEYKQGSRKRSISGKIRAGKARLVDPDKYKPAWKKRSTKARKK